MKDQYEKIRLEWINFLERFSANQLDIKFSKTETKYVSFIMENILDTNISFSDHYGFLTIVFNEAKTKKKFLEIFDKNSTSENCENQNVSKINYPCQVYENKLMINFYDDDNLIKNNNVLDKRVYVFENMFNIIIKIKIENIKLNLI